MRHRIGILYHVTGTSLLTRLDARDRVLFTRWVVAADASRFARLFWRVLTHLGGASATIALCTVPLWLDHTVSHTVAHAARTGVVILVVSHLLVQVVKRSVGRPRPSRHIGACAWVGEPDRFSFPSGHAAAAMSVGLAYAVAFPALAVPLLTLAMVIGASRVCLGVHYPGDVVIGQLIALIVGAAVYSA